MKIRFYLATAIFALSWMGCSQEEATNEIMSGANVIQATIESSSRSAVTDAGVFSWTTGDKISLLDESNKDILKEILSLLFTKEQWDKDELETICKRKGLMLGSILEEINDYSYSVVDDVVLEDEGDTISVIMDYKDELL